MSLDERSCKFCRLDGWPNGELDASSMRVASILVDTFSQNDHSSGPLAAMFTIDLQTLRLSLANPFAFLILDSASFVPCFGAHQSRLQLGRDVSSSTTIRSVACERERERVTKFVVLANLAEISFRVLGSEIGNNRRRDETSFLHEVQSEI